MKGNVIFFLDQERMRHQNRQQNTGYKQRISVTAKKYGLQTRDNIDGMQYVGYIQLQREIVQYRSMNQRLYRQKFIGRNPNLNIWSYSSWFSFKKCMIHRPGGTIYLSSPCIENLKNFREETLLNING